MECCCSVEVLSSKLGCARRSLEPGTSAELSSKCRSKEEGRKVPLDWKTCRGRTWRQGHRGDARHVVRVLCATCATRSLSRYRGRACRDFAILSLSRILIVVPLYKLTLITMQAYLSKLQLRMGNTRRHQVEAVVFGEHNARTTPPSCGREIEMGGSGVF